MKHKRSLEALIVGFVLAIAVSFFSTKIAGAVLAVSLIQMFAFYRCPHCGYGLYNVCGIMPSCCPNCGERSTAFRQASAAFSASPRWAYASESRS